MNNNLKMDINFLDKPLYFLNLKSVGKAFVWEDIKGYIYRSGYNLPDYFDMLILLYLLLKSQREGFKPEIVLSRYEILKECDLNLGERYYTRLEECLKRWKNVSIEFKGTFYDGKKYKTMLFGIIDNAEIREEDKRVVVKFNENWLVKVKESNFYKYLNFEFYKQLKKPVSRRLYELMLPKCYDGKEWYIYATNLGHHLGMAKRQIKKKQGTKEVVTKEVMYASDVLMAMKAAFNEINQLSTVPDICEKLKISPNELFKLNYTVKGEKQKRMVYIKKEPVNSPTVNTETAQPLEFTESPFAGILSTIHQGPLPNVAPNPLALPKPPDPCDSPKIDPLPATENLPAQLLEQYEDGIAWIKQTVPDFNLRSLDKLEKENLAAYFPKLRDKFEHDMAKGKVDSPGAYLLECIRHQWERVKNRKEKQAEKDDCVRKRQKAEEEKKERKEKEVMLKKEQLENLIKEHMEKLVDGASDRWEKAKDLAEKTQRASAFSIKINFSRLLAKELEIETEDFGIQFLAKIAQAFEQYQPQSIKEFFSLPKSH